MRLALLAIVLVACGSETMLTASGQGGAKGSGTGTGSGGASGAGGASSTALPSTTSSTTTPTSTGAAGGASDAGSGGGTTTGGDDICYVDFPCAYYSGCDPSTPGQIRHFSNVNCDVLCGTPNCSGADCQGLTLEDCPAGAVCVTLEFAWPDMVVQCVPPDQACGGPDALPCPVGQFCELGPYAPDGEMVETPCDGLKAGAYGRCLPKPDPATCQGAGTVCGCDGVMYENDCLRQAAGVAGYPAGAICP